MELPIKTKLAALCLLFGLSTPALSFYQWQEGESDLEFRGLLRGFGTAYQLDTADSPAIETSDEGVAAVGRLLLDAHRRDRAFELNVSQSYIPNSLLATQPTVQSALDVERSSALEWSFTNDAYAHLVIDRMNLRWSGDRLDLTLGRQAINLATTFYFTPNDFFAPFAAQVFFRVYKSGVDSVRAEYRLGELSQLSFYGVLGYELDPDSDTGWSASPNSERHSYLARASATKWNFEWAILGGKVKDRNLFGASLQGELFQWLGLRAEGHYANPENRETNNYLELSVGLEHRFANSLTLRWEQFYHGSGADSVDEYLMQINAMNESFYLAHNYSALGAGYEFTPLLNAETVFLINLDDHSSLLSINAVYSLSDESELVINVGLPFGSRPFVGQLQSEFGSYPYSLNIEYRGYF